MYLTEIDLNRIERKEIFWDRFNKKKNYIKSREWSYEKLGKLKHSHKKREDSLETRAVLIEISMLC